MSKENEEKLLDDAKNSANIEKISNELSEEDIDKLVEAHFLSYMVTKAYKNCLKKECVMSEKVGCAPLKMLWQMLLVRLTGR